MVAIVGDNPGIGDWHATLNQLKDGLDAFLSSPGNTDILDACDCALHG